MKRTLTILTVATLVGLCPARAANVSLTDNDAFNTTSFNVAGHWSNGAPPTSANDYFTAGFRLRTPPDGGVYIFQGNSLTVDAPTGSNPTDSFMYKGTGNTGSLTVSNLVLNGGRFSHQNGVNDICIIYGKINVPIDSQIWAKQGPINIFSEISGPGNLAIEATDDNGTIGQRNVTFLTDNPNYTGKITVSGKLGIVSEESLGANPSAFAADQLTLNGGALRTTNSFAIDDSNRGVTLGGPVIIDVVNPDASTTASLTIASPITGSGPLTMTGGGILTLSGNNDFSSGFTVGNNLPAGAQLNINSASALGLGVFTQDDADAILDNGSGSPLTLTGFGAGQTWLDSFTFLGSSSLDMSALGAVSLGADAAVTVSNNSLTVGAVNGDGLGRTLTKRGPGTLTINGVGGYYGDTVVEEGSLVFVGSGAFFSPVITVASNATLDVSGAGGLTLSSIATFAGSQALTGSGTVVGNVADDGFGSTAIDPGSSPGTLTVNGDLGLNGGSTLDFELSPTTTVGGGVNDLIVVTGELSLAGATTLDITGVPTTGTYTLIQYGSFAGSLANLTAPPGYTLNNNTSAKTVELIVTHVPSSLSWQGDDVNNVWDVGTTANWIESGTNQVFFNGDVVTFDDSGSSSPAISLASDVSPFSVTVNASSDYTLTGGGIATGSLTKSGTGTLILDNTNVYSGPTVIEGGTLQVGDPFSLTTFGLAGTIGTGPVTNNANLVFNRGSDLTLANNVYGSGSISNIGSSGTVVLNGNVSGSTVTVAGFGGLALAGSNSYSGLTLVSSGSLHARSTNALGLPAANTVIMDSGQLYIDRNVDISDEALTLSGAGPATDGALRKGGGGVSVVSSPITLDSDVTIGVDGGATLVLSNAAGLSGAVALTKTGLGALSLQYPSTYSGGTTLSDGVINYNTNGALASGAIEAPGAGRIVIAAGQTLANNINGGAVSPGAAQGFLIGLADAQGNSATASGTITFTDSPATGGTFAGPGGTNYFHVTGSVTSPAGTYVSVRNGNVRLSGGGSYPEFRAGIGTTSIGANNGIASNAVMDMAAFVNAFTTVYFDLNGFNQTLAGLANLVNLDGAGYVTNSSATLSTLTLSVDSAAPQSFGGGIVGNVSLVMNSGTQVFATNGSPLTAVFTYTGDTLINGGSLVLSNNVQLTGTPVINIANGATLDVSDGSLALGGGQTLKGTGTVAGNVVADGIIAPGTSIGTLTINGDLTINGNLAFEVDKSLTPSNDVASVSGSLANTGTGTLIVSRSGPALVVGDKFTLFNKPVANGAAITVAGGGATWVNNLAVDGSITVSDIVAAGSTNITFSVSGNTLSLSWPSSHLGWILQSQTNSLSTGLQTGGNEWFDVPGSDEATFKDITINPEDPAVFFRLRQP